MKKINDIFMTISIFIVTITGIFGFIYEFYFDVEQLVYLEEVDFGTEYENIWFLDSCCSPWLPDETLNTYGLNKEYIGHYGIEHNEFQLWCIYK